MEILETHLYMKVFEELHRDMIEGKFTQAAELEILEEEIKVLELINLPEVQFYAPTNYISIQGTLPKDREKMIQKLRYIISVAGESLLNSVKERASL